MSKRESDGEFDDDLVNAEFESMVEGLSLDESSPTTYLDELDRRRSTDWRSVFSYLDIHNPRA